MVINTIGVVGNGGMGSETLVISGHLDTVPFNRGAWTFGPHDPTVKDGKLCVTLDAGPTAGKEGCNPFADHKVGDTRDVTLADGTKSKAALVAGR